MKAVVGLGNPGKRYANTRHNVGFKVVDAVAADMRAQEWNLRCQSLVMTVASGGEQVVLAKPLTYMNLSGRAVEQLANHYDLGPGDVIIVYDDLDLPLGKVRIRERGSAGGHHGMQSVIRFLETEEIPRVRLGIDEGTEKGETAEYVLSDFTSDRVEEVGDMVGRAASAIRSILSDGITKAMSVYNA